MKFLRLLSIASVLSFALVTTAAPGSIKDIKGTWQVIVPEQRLALSPACGALDSETKYTEKLWYFGNPDHATVQLVKAIFMPVAGAFQLSKLNQPAIFFSVRTIGKLLGAIQLNEGRDSAELKKILVDAIIADEDFKQALQKKYKNKLDISYKNYDGLVARLGATEDYATIKTKASEYLIRQKLFKRGVAKDQELLDAVGAYHQTKPENPGFDVERTIAILEAKIVEPKVKATIKALEPVLRFVDLIINSLLESKPGSLSALLPFSSSSSSSGASSAAFSSEGSREHGSDVGFQHYEQYATQHILLTWLYRKASNKTDFATYFSSLPQEFLMPDKMFDVQDVYEGEEYLAILSGLVTDLNSREGVDIFSYLQRDTDLASIVYAELMNQKYGQDIPYLPEYATVFFDGVDFATCVETAIRNLCNIVTYDKKSRIFGNSFSSLNMYQTLRDFYAKKTEEATNNSEDDVQKPQVYQDWSDIVQNLPYIAYAEIKRPGSPKALSFKNIETQIDGFIKLPGITLPDEAEYGELVIKLDGADHTFRTIKIHNQTFALVETDDYYVFEVMPSIQNTIIMLDRLLGLGLFSSSASSSSGVSASNFVNVFFNPDFNSVYFTQVCERVGWKIEGDFDVAVLDNRSADQVILLKKGEADFKFNLYPRKHAYAERVVNEEAQEEYRRKLCQYRDDIMDIGFDPMVLFVTKLYGPKPIDGDAGFTFSRESHRAWNCSLFRTYDLFDPRKKIDLVRVMISSTPESTTQDHASLSAQLIRGIEFDPDLYYPEQMARIMNESLDFFGKYQNNSQLCNALNDFFDKVYVNKHDEGRMITFSYFIKVSRAINDRTTFEKIIQLARELSENEGAHVSMLALQLLVENGYTEAYARAFDFAMAYITHEDSDHCSDALHILKALIKQGYEPSFGPVLELFINRVTDENFKYYAFDMLDALAEQKDNPASRQVLQVAVQERADRLRAMLQNDALESWNKEKIQNLLHEFVPSASQGVGTQELEPLSEELPPPSEETSTPETQETLTVTPPSSVVHDVQTSLQELPSQQEPVVLSAPQKGQQLSVPRGPGHVPAAQKIIVRDGRMVTVGR